MDQFTGSGHYYCAEDTVRAGMALTHAAAAAQADNSTLRVTNDRLTAASMVFAPPAIGQI